MSTVRERRVTIEERAADVVLSNAGHHRKQLAATGLIVVKGGGGTAHGHPVRALTILVYGQPRDQAATSGWDCSTASTEFCFLRLESTEEPATTRTDLARARAAASSAASLPVPTELEAIA